MPKKGRTFDGCWTCRSRKVKCDLSKPKCQRCIKSKRKCKGYDIRLGWSNPMTISKVDSSLCVLNKDEEIDLNFQRRSIELVKFPKEMYYETYSKLNKILEKMDMNSGEGDYKIGPFQCFKSGIRHIEQDKVTQDKVTQDKVIQDKVIQDKEKQDKVIQDPVIEDLIEDSIDLDHQDNSHVHYNLVEFSKLTVVAIKGLNYKFNDQNMLHILYPKYYPNMDSDDDWVVNSHLVHDKLYKLSNHMIIYPVFQQLLIKLNSTWFSFNKFHFKCNYIDLLIFPYVKQLIGEFICMTQSWTEKVNPKEFNSILNNIKLTVIYLMLGISAFHQSSQTVVAIDSSDENLKLSIELRKLSISMLNYHLDESDTILDLKNSYHNSNEYETLILLAIILQIELDCSFSVFENLDLLYAIGDFVIVNNFRGGKYTNLNKYLINIFKMKSIFFESTKSVNMFNYEINQIDQEINYGDLKDSYNLIDNLSSSEDESDQEEIIKFKPTIENLLTKTKEKPYSPLSYTINFDKQSSISAFEKSEEPPKEKTFHLNNVSFSPAYIDHNLMYLMYGIPKSLIDIFHQIIHLTNHRSIFSRRKVFPRNFPKICAEIEDKLINWKTPWSLGEDKIEQIINLSSLAFQKAQLVYFNKLLKKNYDPIVNNQLAIDSLEYFVKSITIANEIKFDYKPNFWVLLICGCSIMNKLHQDMIKEIWNNELFKKQSNYWRAKQILYEVWSRKELGEDENNLGFMNMIQEWDIVLSLG